MKIYRSGAAVLLLAQAAFAYTSANKHLDHPDEWYKTDEAHDIADNLLSWQTPLGGWPKNEDTGGKPHTGDASKLLTTFDNGATSMELRYLARMAGVTKEAKYIEAFNRGLDCILKTQYPTGGWPQRTPAGNGYHKHITFNDGVVARLLFFLRDIDISDRYAFVDADRKAAAKKAHALGVDCILKCQIRVNGQLTVWCAQHDEIDYSPRPARLFEPASLSGQESLGIMNVLMHVDNPTPEIIAAVDSAAAWFEKSKIFNTRVVDTPNPASPKGFDRKAVSNDATAPVVWARFYEIETNRPIFLDRDSTKRYSLNDIDPERRNGYQWYGSWATKRLETEYPEWRKKVTATTAPSK